MENNQKLITGEASIPRRRGRPAGHNRVPLSREERRARNAEYERERREDYKQAILELIEATGADPNMSQADLLAFSISFIRQKTKARDNSKVDDIRQDNKKLKTKIAKKMKRLDAKSAALLDDDASQDLDTEGPTSESSKEQDSSTSGSSKEQDSSTSGSSKATKIQRKKRKRSKN